MPTILFLFIFAVSIWAQDSNIEKNISLTRGESMVKKELSQKEKAYQKSLKEREKQNKKLEDDGFCSCNND